MLKYTYCTCKDQEYNKAELEFDTCITNEPLYENIQFK